MKLLSVFLLLSLIFSCRTVKTGDDTKKNIKKNTVDNKKITQKVPRKRKPQIKKVSKLGKRLYVSFKTRDLGKCLEHFPSFEELSRTLEEEDIVEYSMKDYPKLKREYVKSFHAIIKKYNFSKSKFKELIKGEKQTISKKGEKNYIFLFHDNKLVFIDSGEEKTLKIPVILLIDGNYFIPILHQ